LLSLSWLSSSHGSRYRLRCVMGVGGVVLVVDVDVVSVEETVGVFVVVDVDVVVIAKKVVQSVVVVVFVVVFVVDIIVAVVVSWES
jgi:hypothetical protein